MLELILAMESLRSLSTVILIDPRVRCAVTGIPNEVKAVQG